MPDVESATTPFASGTTIPADCTATIAPEYVAPFFGSSSMHDIFSKISLSVVSLPDESTNAKSATLKMLIG